MKVQLGIIISLGLPLCVEMVVDHPDAIHSLAKSNLYYLLSSLYGTQEGTLVRDRFIKIAKLLGLDKDDYECPGKLMSILQHDIGCPQYTEQIVLIFRNYRRKRFHFLDFMNGSVSVSGTPGSLDKCFLEHNTSNYISYR